MKAFKFILFDQSFEQQSLLTVQSSRTSEGDDQLSFGLRQKLSLICKHITEWKKYRLNLWKIPLKDNKKQKSLKIKGCNM